MLKSEWLIEYGLGVLMLSLVSSGLMAQGKQMIDLPKPIQAGQYSLGQLLQQRRSLREYSNEPVNLTHVSQLLWAAQGITDTRGLRTAPSAGALYPLELYVVAGNVTGLEAGVYHYQIHSHSLVQHVSGDKRHALAQAAYMQSWLSEAPVVIVFSADYKRTSKKYGARAERYVQIETGHAAQNLFLQAGDLDLGSVVVGAFYDDAVAEVLQLPSGFKPLVLMPVGKE
jgi:SagB-type dehydrogenase family enzyme